MRCNRIRLRQDFPGVFPSVELAAAVRLIPVHPRASGEHDLREDFGIDPAALRERFDFYFERFPIRLEDGSD